ncbi:MAG: hypothetical protein QOE65_268 [Solirubrobacteraceae bacterium]|jgi:hypothetical protein|nr:hypothetical protein [Solirubrobacteraceae bacterium]
MDARRLTLALTAATALLVAAPAAQGAYAPKLSVTVKPTDQPGSRIALSTVVTQAGDEDPTKSARVKFPIGFGLDLRALQNVAACTPAQRDARACPAASRLGTATAMALGQTLTGGVHLGVNTTIYIFLENATLRLLGQEPKPITARIEFRPGGGTDTVLDELPTDFTATRFELALDGPPKSILNAPTRCGQFPFVGQFVGKGGATATSTSSVTITNCPPPPVPAFTLTRVSLVPRSVVLGRAATLRYRVNRAATVEITVRRAGTTRILARKRFSHPANKPNGRIAVGTGGLRRGFYVVTLRAKSGAVARTRVFTLRVR